MMQFGMRREHEVLYYNASIANPHIAGIARVASEPYADPSAFDRSSAYFDAQSDPAAPTWFLVDVRFEREFARPVYLAELRLLVESGALAKDFTLFRRTRLSIHPLTREEFDFLVDLSTKPLPAEVKLKPERSVHAHPSRARSTAGTAKKKHGWKRKKSSEKEADETEDDNDEVACGAADGVVTGGVSNLSGDVIPMDVDPPSAAAASYAPPAAVAATPRGRKKADVKSAASSKKRSRTRSASPSVRQSARTQARSRSRSRSRSPAPATAEAPKKKRI
jgi:predicted RNA-binding protein with PUA-like domain